MCTECGGICCYADDSTYTVTANTPEELTTKLDDKFKVMSKYLTDNQLCINSDKTHILVMSTRQKKRKSKQTQTQVTLNTGKEVILPTRTETLLGFKVHDSMSFSEHLMDNKESLIKILNKRIGALKQLRKAASFKAKLNIANGIIMSKILYLLPLYGGCPEYLLSAIQTKQNEAMRQVTGRRWVVPGKQFVSTSDLLKQCGWLSVRQLSFYTTVLSVHNTLVHKTPEYLYNKLTGGHCQRTRAAAIYKVERTCVDEARLKIASESYRWRGHQQHSMIPTSLKDETNINYFKIRLKLWVKENISI